MPTYELQVHSSAHNKLDFKGAPSKGFTPLLTTAPKFISHSSCSETGFLKQDLKKEKKHTLGKTQETKLKNNLSDNS